MAIVGYRAAARARWEHRGPKRSAEVRRLDEAVADRKGCDPESRILGENHFRNSSDGEIMNASADTRERVAAGGRPRSNRPRNAPG